MASKVGCSGLLGEALNSCQLERTGLWCLINRNKALLIVCCTPKCPGRRSAFRTVEERDKHLKKQSAEIQQSIAQLEALIQRSMSDRQKSEKQIEQEKAAVEKRKNETQRKERELADVGKELSRLMLLRSDKQEERKVGVGLRAMDYPSWVFVACLLFWVTACSITRSGVPNTTDTLDPHRLASKRLLSSRRSGAS